MSSPLTLTIACSNPSTVAHQAGGHLHHAKQDRKETSNRHCLHRIAVGSPHLPMPAATLRPFPPLLRPRSVRSGVEGPPQSLSEGSGVPLPCSKEEVLGCSRSTKLNHCCTSLEASRPALGSNS